ncbi:DUF1194 domain-containing protein [Breoghania sp.]|uniref:DUF1194 domain-containing protein n=1 Tax=Breoghania sp. TaxID=2065378 RepID=UPI002AA603ED|nr:DUF1194 domain-containing protein [Breoghania sp.]
MRVPQMLALVARPARWRTHVLRAALRVVLSGIVVAGLLRTQGEARTLTPGEEIDLALVLAVDISYSMDREEQRLQRLGYISAITSPQVLKAIQSGLTGKIAVSYMEWAGATSQFTLVDWHMISDLQSAQDFASALAEAPIQRAYRTSISGGLLFAARLMKQLKAEPLRRVIDVSGDGPNNQGIAVLEARKQVLAQNITVNGLPLLLARAEKGWYDIDNLDAYYARCVIGGPGAFAIPVHDIKDFAEAVRMKLILEIAGASQPSLVRPAGYEAQDEEFCLIGERIWRDRIRQYDDDWRQNRLQIPDWKG